MKFKNLLFLSLLITLSISSCERIETKLNMSVKVFNKDTPVEGANVEIIKVNNISFGVNGKEADRETIDNVSLDSEGNLNYVTDVPLEELEFIIEKDGFIEYLSRDNFTIQQGDETSLNIEMYEESFIKIIMVDAPGVNNNKVEVTVLLQETNNTVHEFNGGNHELVKRANGDTENTILVSRDDGTPLPEEIFVATRDTTFFPVIY